MFILGIESSCDDMSAAVVKDGSIILSNIVKSQDELHSGYGGIVPELASRRHIDMVIPVVAEALNYSGKELSDIDMIGVTKGPGLIGSILIGLSFAKAVSYVSDIPFIGVNHVTSHPLASLLDANESPCFPFIALVVSGGHTALFKFDGPVDYHFLGDTRDDAAGEAFDKVAKLLGFSYPGGVVIDRLAKEGDPLSIPFKRPFLSKGSLEFSFSGLKTAVLNYLRGVRGTVSETEKSNIAASFQAAVVEVLVEKAFYACSLYNISSLVVSGGVACNSFLRARFYERGEADAVMVSIPPPSLCSDNAAMIAASAYYLLQSAPPDGLFVDADPNLGYERQ